MSMPPVPEHSPNWAFGPDQEVMCPTCDTVLRGINWIMGPPDAEPEQQAVTGMTLVPCAHELTTPPWTLEVGARGKLMFQQTGV